MKRLKGPELKMPELKAPAALADFYYDLRDRRLLPVIALVVVAIVATPILLGQKSETTLPPAASGAIQALRESHGERSASLTVVEAHPGLRDYRKRLGRRKPLDPFRSMGKPNLEGAQLGNGKEGGEGGSSGSAATFSSTSTTVKKTKNSKTTTTTTTATTGSGEGSEGGQPGGGPGGAEPGGSAPGGSPPVGKGPHLVYFAYAIDVRIVKSVDGQAQEPITRKKVLAQTALPGEKEPVVTFMGAARDGKKPTGKALLLVSDQVTEVAGDAKCLSGEETCQLLEVEPGFPVVLTYGEGGVKYTVDVLKLELVVTGHS
jgi:hypothetical protein